MVQNSGGPQSCRV